MANGREPRQVAKRALILSTISFRSSLEVTAHPRVAEISGELLPWLIDVGCDDDIDPIERDLLSTPYGELSDSQKMDARWSGESAAFFCWMVNLGEKLEEMASANPSTLPTLLAVLKPQADGIIDSATFRERKEIDDTCRLFVLMRSLLQESRADAPTREIIRRLHAKKLGEVGLSVTEDAIKQAADAVGRMTPEDRRRVAGLYFVRHHAALWFLSDSKNYYA